MAELYASQVRAARALLGWKQEDLAEASGMSLTAVRSFETGYTPRGSTLNAIRTAIENAGLEFLADEGIKRSNPEVTIYRGVDSCDRFFHDMAQVVKIQSGDVLAAIKSPDVLTLPIGIDRRCNLERLEPVGECATIKCLFLDISAPPHCNPTFQLRATASDGNSVLSYFIYGDKYAFVLPEGRINFMIVVFSISVLTLEHRQHFNALWSNAVPLREQTQSQKRHT
jgi:transcriptional regulator with XRE-family HTH domain